MRKLTAAKLVVVALAMVPSYAGARVPADALSFNGVLETTAPVTFEPSGRLQFDLHARGLTHVNGDGVLSVFGAVAPGATCGAMELRGGTGTIDFNTGESWQIRSLSAQTVAQTAWVQHLAFVAGYTESDGTAGSISGVIALQGFHNCDSTGTRSFVVVGEGAATANPF